MRPTALVRTNLSSPLCSRLSPSPNFKTQRNNNNDDNASSVLTTQRPPHAKMGNRSRTAALFGPALLAAAAAVSAALVLPGAAATATAASAETKTPLPSLPLVSHHGLKQRRRRERRERERRLENELLVEEKEDVDDEADRRRLDQHLAPQYQGYGTHYADLWVGTPPQRQTVIVDTGSGKTAFPCSGCQDCGDKYHIDAFFVEEESSTFHKLDCQEDGCYSGSCHTGVTSAARTAKEGPEQICKLHQGYSEGSKWDAYEATDVSYVGGPHDEPLDLPDEDAITAAGQFRLEFGCQTLITGLFKTQLADGIMGMVNERTSYWAQMYKAGESIMPEKSFSLCFSRQPTASREGTEAGTMTLGGTNEALHETPMVYAKDVNPKSEYFTVGVRKIYLREGGGESAAMEGKKVKSVLPLDIDPSSLRGGSHGVIVDSGTTMTYLSKKIGKAFKSKWESVTGRKYTNDGIKLTDKELHSLPTVLFQFEASDDGVNGAFEEGTPGLTWDIDPSNPRDVIVAMPASHYMLYEEDDKVYRSGIYLDKGSGSTLGANLMMGHDIHFDVVAGRIGWAESTCDYFDLTGVEPPSSSIERGKPDEEEEGETGGDEVVADDDNAEEEDDDDADEVNPEEDEETEESWENDEEKSSNTDADGNNQNKDDDDTATIGVKHNTEDDLVCPTNGCKASVLAVVLILAIAFVIYRRRYGIDRRGIVALPQDDDELELYEEDLPSGGYSDNVKEPSAGRNISTTEPNDGSDDDDPSEYTIS